MDCKTALSAVALALALVGCRGPDPFREYRKDVADATKALNEPNAKEVTRNANRLGWATLRDFKSDGDVLISPLGLTLILSLVREGAAGDTRSELDRFIGSANGSPPLDIALAQRLIFQYARRDASTKVAGVIAPGPKTQLDSKFVETAKAAGFEVLGQPESINDWLSKASDGNIQSSKVLPPVAGGLYLANALDFAGAWDDPFWLGNTKPGSFRTASGEELPVNMMNADLAAGFRSGPNWSAVAIPFKDGRFYFWIALPSKGLAIDEFIPQASTAFEEFGQSAEEVVAELSLPRFQSISRESLRDALVSHGAKNAFDSRMADLTGMSPVSGLHLVDVAQQARLTVDEEGAKAQVVTEGEAAAGGAASEPRKVKFVVDRPFLFAIFDNDTDGVLLLGAIRRPTPK